ncbi:MAG: endolytic transglycosylase MltG [Bacteroidaceae bacterium]|nr:endolytic transglycosylase MltG [Bacteroidaceae bacterium]
MTTKKRTIIIIVAALLAIFAVAALIVANMFCHKLSPRETTYIYIDDDDDIDSVRTKLSAADANISMKAFDWLVAWKHYDQHIRVGRYEVSKSKSTLDLFRDLRNHNSQPINLVVPSVRTIDIMAGRLARQLMIDSATIAAKFHDQNTIKELGYTRETFPALFIPNTYEIYWETSVDKLMERLAKENKAFWNADRTALASQIGLTKNEVVTLASIVDSETANNGEKARIAGLYMNRLHRGILLQSDPTVIFAVGDFSIRRVLNKHLQTESPYNTYRVAGLPPGPIRIPSIAGIDAVLTYEHNDYIYMCAKEDFSGTHNFAVSYADHMANARRYINALNQRGIK